MKTVGIRNLRDSLSRYINYVKEGETIYVTDHGRIVAEIVPSGGNNGAESLLKDYIGRQAAEGRMIPATMQTRLEEAGTPQAPDTELITEIYRESRKERL